MYSCPNQQSHRSIRVYYIPKALVIIILFKLSKLRLRQRPLELNPLNCRFDRADPTMYQDHLGDYYHPPVGALVLIDDSKMAEYSIL